MSTPEDVMAVALHDWLEVRMGVVEPKPELVMGAVEYQRHKLAEAGYRLVRMVKVDRQPFAIEASP